MNREQVIAWAREAWRQTGENWVVPHWFEERAASFEHFANLVAAAERERCAQVCDEFESEADLDAGFVLAAAIRARGNT